MRAIYQLPSIALVGPPGSGRSGLLRALAPSSRHRANLSSRLAADHGRAVVDDPLLGELAGLLGSDKNTPIEFEFVDCQAGLTSMQGQAEWFGNLANYDALAAVLGLFSYDDPETALESALAAVRDELTLWDLGLAERRMQRLDADLARAPRAERAPMERDRELFAQIVERLDDGGELVQVELGAGERRLLRGFGFLSNKPFLVIANTSDSAVGEWDRLQAQCRWPLVGVSVQLETEVAELEPGLGAELLAEFGIGAETVSRRVLADAARVLEIRTCYTANRREARAWAVGPLATALDLADAVHSDVARGFVRAEVIAARELLEHGSLARVRELGRLRREGRNYQLVDGDLVNVLFSG